MPHQEIDYEKLAKDTTNVTEANIEHISISLNQTSFRTAVISIQYFKQNF